MTTLNDQDSDDSDIFQLGGELDPSDFTDRVDSSQDAIGPICLGQASFTHAPSGVTVQQESEKGLSFQIWPSSTFLADYAIKKDAETPGCWQGMRVLELGCGCGLVGLVWAHLGAHVMLTDLPSVMDLVRSNIHRNTSLISPKGSATAAALPWGQAAVDLGAWACPDLIVASDVVYDRDLFGLLLSTLGSLGRPGTTQLLLAHVRRWKTDRRFFTGLHRLYEVDDITGEMDPAAAQLSSHTTGSRRLFRGVRK